jgi:hypothetical protein
MKSFEYEVPLMLVGPTKVGKTSYLLALAKLFSSPTPLRTAFGEFSFAMGDGLEELRERLGGRHDALEDPERTAALSDYDFSVTFTSGETASPLRMRFSVADYRGEDIEAGKHAPELKKRIEAARAFLFFVDGRDVGIPSSAAQQDAAKKRAIRYVNILKVARASGEDRLRHVPVALVVNKADVIFGEALPDRPFLIDPRTAPEAIHAGRAGDGRAPFERLRECVRQDPMNNLTLAVQRFAWTVLRDFEKFLTEVLGITYRYQVFTTASRQPTPDLVAERDVFPYGVLQPLGWLVQQLAVPYLHQLDRELTQVVRDQGRRLACAEKEVEERTARVKGVADAENALTSTKQSGTIPIIRTEKKKADAVKYREAELEQARAALRKSLLDAEAAAECAPPAEGRSDEERWKAVAEGVEELKRARRELLERLDDVRAAYYHRTGRYQLEGFRAQLLQAMRSVEELVRRLEQKQLAGTAADNRGVQEGLNRRLDEILPRLRQHRAELDGWGRDMEAVQRQLHGEEPLSLEDDEP